MSPPSGKWIETPEGVRLRLTTAGFGVRFYAWAIDLLVRGAFYVAALVPLAYLGELGGGLIMLLLFVGEWFYPVLFEVLNDGATPGKRLLGITVVHSDATPVGLAASMLRNLVRVIDLLPGTYTIGLLSTLISRDNQRLGDLVAGTLVVYRATVAAPPAPFPADAIAPRFTLTPGERFAVRAYAERFRDLPPQRAESLAALTAPLVEHGSDAAPQLLGVARWHAGDHR